MTQLRAENSGLTTFRFSPVRYRAPRPSLAFVAYSRSPQIRVGSLKNLLGPAMPLVANIVLARKEKSLRTNLAAVLSSTC